MRVQFSFSWGTRLTVAQAEALNEVIGVTKVRLKQEEKKEHAELSDIDRLLAASNKPDTLPIDNYDGTFVGEIVDIYSVIPDVQIVLKGLEASPNYTNLMASLDKLQALLGPLANKEVLFNQRCDVHVPGLGLLAIEEVRHENDCCTDYLRDLMADGWRIIAACPQPDQRRPDYILGRSRNAG